MESQPMTSQASMLRPTLRSGARKTLRAKLVVAFGVVLAFAGTLRAQETPPPQTPAPSSSQDFQSESLRQGSVEYGFLAGGGTGLGKSDGTQFVLAGGRVGWVLTGDHLPWLLKGKFEWAVDILPLYPVLLPGGSAIYAGSVRPAVWKWNFTSGKKFAPYVAAEGGVVFSTHNVPPGDTSKVNFTPSAAAGTHYFFAKNRDVFFEGTLGHLSSASIGPHNPGYNVTLLFTVGMTWFKGGH
jgi:hypothetical protein